jgi:hypothetical protein
MATRVCTKCGNEKDIELFVVVSRYPDGHGASCKECHNSYNSKKYYEDVDGNRAKSRDRTKRYYHKDKEKSCTKAKQYRLDNIEQVKETDKKYRIKNKDKIAIKKKIYVNANKDKKKRWDKTYAEKHAGKLAIKKQEYYFKNKEHLTQYKKEWAKKNKEHLQQYKHQYYLDHVDEVKQKTKDYYANNRELVNKRLVEYRNNNNQARIAHNLRTRIGNIVKGRSSGGRMRELVGCDLGTFIAHLESLWDENMNWGNYGIGKDKWSMDHIIPIEWHDLEDNEDCKKAFHFSNTQPMWNPQNASKSNRYSGGYRK